MCDRHHATPAVSAVVILESDERMDLCESCLQQIRSFLGNEKQKTVDPQPRKGLIDRLKDSVNVT